MLTELSRLFSQQFYNTDSTTARELFNKKNVGGIETDDLFEYGRTEGVGVYIQDKANTFRVTFVPWDPDNKDDFPDSEWSFECFDDNAILNEYSQQMCGKIENQTAFDQRV